MLRLLAFATAAIALFVGSAQAQSAPDLPREVASAIAESREACKPATAQLEPKFLTRRDVNRDGVPDYILDYRHFVCAGSRTFFCGSGGCTMQVLVSGAGGFTTALDQNVRKLAFGSVRGRPAILLELHGSECGKVGYAPCKRTLIWDGTKFVSGR